MCDHQPPPGARYRDQMEGRERGPLEIGRNRIVAARVLHRVATQRDDE
jgi:hypothetical protein